jgi:hypothetical protein
MTFNNESWIEGTPGEHMVALNTKDQGKTWSPMVDIEPYLPNSTNTVSAYGSIVGRPDGSRLFSMYIMNDHNVSHLPGANASASWRADMLGDFVWRYSDTRGKTWSEQSYRIPVPETFIDRHNDWNGTGVQVMWEVDHVKVVNGSAMFAFTKIATYAVAAPEEIFIAVSRNLLDPGTPPGAATWEIWPDQNHGIEAVGGTRPFTTNTSFKKWHADPLGIAEEGHVMPLGAAGDHRFACVFRTSQGYLGSATSSKVGPRAPWERSGYATYLPVSPLKGGAPTTAVFVPPEALMVGIQQSLAGSMIEAALRPGWAEHALNNQLKNPRGPISPKKQPNGLWLMTFYFDGGFGAFASHMSVNDRNNMWLTAGHEVGGGHVLWTQPELLLYDRHHPNGHGYPDLVTTLPRHSRP